MGLVTRKLMAVTVSLAAAVGLAVVTSVVHPASAAPLPVKPDSAPAVIQLGGGSNTFTAIRTADNRLFYTTGNWTGAWGNGGWNEWKEIPGGGRSEFAPAVAKLDGKVYVAVVGLGGKSMFTQAYTPNGSWEGKWHEIPGGGTFIAGPAVAALEGAQLAFAAPGLSGQVHYQHWHLSLGFYDGSWKKTIPGLTTNTAVGLSFAYAYLHVIARGNNKQIYSTTLDNGTFKPWIEVPGGGLTNHAPALTTVPAANYGKGLVAVVRGVDNGLFYQTTDSKLKWRPSWKQLTHSGNTQFAPAVAYVGGSVTPYVVGQDRGVYGQAITASDSTGSTYVPHSIYGGWFVIPGSVVSGGGGTPPPPPPPTPLPDLGFTGQPFIDLSEKRIYITFKNFGTAGAGGFRVHLLVNGTLYDHWIFNGAASGVSQTIYADVSYLSSTDSYNFVVDPYSTVAESSEGNNSYNGYLGTVPVVP